MALWQIFANDGLSTRNILGVVHLVPKSDSETTGATQRESRDALAAGTKLRSYEIVSVLGIGSFGITYRARDGTLNRDVAIKEYLPSSLALREGGMTVVPRSTEFTEEFVWGRERFLEEARTLAKFGRAPAVVRVHDFLEAHGTAYMVMELVLGETLDERIKRDGSLPSKAIERLIYPLLDGLEQVHGIGFLHRDIKPSNIILDAKGNPTLVDFGASRAAMAGRTSAMTAIFTPGYAAAEQFTSAKQGPWTDIYGLAATLHDAITGKPPPSAFDRMLDDTYEPLARLRPTGFSPSLLKGIDAGLAVRGSDRPQTIPEWRNLLSATAAPFDDRTRVLAPRPPETPTPVQAPIKPPNISAAETPAQPPSGPGGSAGKKRLALYAGLAAALVALGATSYFLLAPKPSPKSVVLQDLKIDDLEKVLAERRVAAAAAAEKARLEENAQRKTENDAASKRAADTELAQAQAERQKAQEELARLKADIEARRQQDAAQKEQADAVARAEQDAQRKASAEAETKRQADAALAAAQAQKLKADQDAAVLRQAEEEATRKSAAEAEAKHKAANDAKQKADAEAAAAAERKVAEAAENGLRLSVTDRQHIQIALTSVGFDTRGSDGVFGPRSREMITGWQKARNLAPTGFLSLSQQQALLREATSALARHDDEQKKIDEPKRTAEDEARTNAGQQPGQATPPAVAAALAIPVAPPNAQPFDGEWRGLGRCAHSSSVWTTSLSVQNNNIVGDSKASGGKGDAGLSIRGQVDPVNGSVTLTVGSNGTSRLVGQAAGRRMTFKGWTGAETCEFTLDQGKAP